MKTITLEQESIHRGNLILVNREHGYQNDNTIQLDFLLNEQTGVLLCHKAAILLNRLMAEINGWHHIIPVSGWRSLDQQQKIWDDSLSENGLEFTKTYVAVPGHSEHQTGLAIDLGLKKKEIDFIRPFFPYEGICQTFREKATKYGFVERYPKNKESVTQIGHEPWHFRYVGIPHAEIMVKQGFALEEYIDYIRQFCYGKTSYLYKTDRQEFAVSFIGAEQAQTKVVVDDSMIYTMSGNNMDGWIITQWRI